MGSNPVIIEVKTLTVVPEPGFTLSDNYYPSSSLILTVNYGNVNLNFIGNYPVRYYVSDSSGNVDSSKVRVYKVVDTKAPSIILNGKDTVIINVKTLTQVPEPGYTLADNYYNPAALIVNPNYGIVKLNQIGLYKVRYYVSDPSGNMDSSKMRFFNVVDTTAPVITLIGPQVIDWYRWKPYVDPGNTVTDNYYTNLTCNPDLSQLNILLPGYYQVFFNITDPSGNKAKEVIRYVNVIMLGINNKTEKDLFHLYANPNKGLLNIDLNIENGSKANITIFDVNGKLVYSNDQLNPDDEKIQIDLSNEASGLYFIKVMADGMTASKTFAIQK